MKSGVNHEENFPVASWLCPPALRPVVAAIYWFARTADDIADEGDAPASQRLADLAAYRQQLALAATPVMPTPIPNAQANPNTQPPAWDTRWAHVFAPLQHHIRQHRLPVALLHDLLSAFEQDVRRTESGQRYQTHDELLAYCRLSANPVGHLLLHLYGITDSELLLASDRVCSALQLINFWQDLSRDLPRQRHYLPQQALAQRGLTEADFAPIQPAPVDAGAEGRKEELIADLLNMASDRMQKGSIIALHVPGRSGWELRLVVQGGMRVAEKIRRMRHRTWLQRPRLRAWDVPLLVWRAWRMGRQSR
jgi:squalene synthase HpnC